MALEQYLIELVRKVFVADNSLSRNSENCKNICSILDEGTTDDVNENVSHLKKAQY